MQIWYNIYISHGVALVVDLSPLNPGFFFVSTPRDALLVVDLSLLAVMYKLLSEKKTKFPTNLFHSRSSFCFVNLFVSVDVDLFLVAFDSELKLL